jgi:thiol-disulfide isomerase/thioredoxin
MRFFMLFVGCFAAIGLRGQSTTPPVPSVRVLSIDQLEEAFRHGGDTLTVYNFWATWCRPCVAELPAFERLGEEYRDRPVRVVLVSLDFVSEREKTLIPFLQKKDIRSPVWLLDGKPTLYIDRISRAWGGSIPATLFVRPSKRTYLFKEQEFAFDELKHVVDELLR